MGSRIQKFLIIHAHSNSNMNIKACYDYYVAPVPSGIFKLYRDHAQNQGCGELKIVITQRTKVGLVSSVPGGFLSPHLCTWTIASVWSYHLTLGQPRWGSCRHTQAQRLWAKVQIEVPNNSEIDRRHLLSTCYQPDILQNRSLVWTHGLPQQPSDIHTGTTNHIWQMKKQTQLMSGREGIPSSNSTILPHCLLD